MLVIKRNLYESVNIGDNIKVIITEIGDKFVRIGFEAPREIPIVRDDAIVKEQKSKKENDNA